MQILRPIFRKFQPKALVVVRNFAKKKVQKGCECPEPPKVEKIVQEKSCKPCTFRSWKPKTRKCIKAEIDEEMQPKKPMKCYAGMVIERPYSDCKTSDINPFYKKPCLPPPKPKEEPPKIAPPEKAIPEADWDFNCGK